MTTFDNRINTATILTKAKEILRSPDATVLLWLGVWWLVNIVTAACSELANDEAYYHIFAERLSWGYFDHPPVTALLVRAGELLFGGELGVRFFFTLLQPLYLWIFWRTIRPADATHSDARLYTMLCAAMLILQLYGFIAVPDGPLLFAAALFLAAFKAFADDKPLSWFALGLATGFMAYCKYHGALVLIFTILANVGWFLRRPRKIALLAAAGAVAFATIIPHLLWQYHHDWASFAYHLSGRNGYFRLSNITDFLVNMAVVFSPFYLPLWVQAYRKVKAETPLQRTLKTMPPAFIIFFTLSSIRGYVQPQWAIAAVFGLVWILFSYARRHPRTRRYVMIAGSVTLVLIALVRIVMIFNPTGIKFEVFDNKTSYKRIADEAAGRPVIFDGSYALAAKYRFYGGTEDAFGQPNINYRTSQWQFRDDDRRFTGRDVLATVNPKAYPEGETTCIELPNGHRFCYREIKDFHPTRETVVTALKPLPESVHTGEVLQLSLRIENPYLYDIIVDGREILFEMLWSRRKEECRFVPLCDGFCIPAGGSIEVDCSVTVPQDLPECEYTVGFAVRHKDMSTWFCGGQNQLAISN